MRLFYLCRNISDVIAKIFGCFNTIIRMDISEGQIMNIKCPVSPP